MNIQELLDNGYKEFKPNPIIRKADRAFQKRVENDIGKKYFITIYYYNSFTDNIDRESYEIDLQFNKIVDNIEFTNNILIFGFGNYNEEKKIIEYDNVNIKDVEKYIEELWSKNEFEYYELWENEI